MKVFKKWWGNLGTVYQTNPLLCPEDRTKRGWQEALTWLKAAATAIELQDSGDGFDIVDLHNIIEEELEEGLTNETKTE